MAEISREVGGDIERKPIMQAGVTLISDKKDCPYEGRFCFKCEAEFKGDAVWFPYSCYFLASYTFYDINLKGFTLRLNTWH